MGFVSRLVEQLVISESRAGRKKVKENKWRECLQHQFILIYANFNEDYELKGNVIDMHVCI